MADSNRRFKVGETVRLRVIVSKAGTRQAQDPSDGVSLVRLDRNGTSVDLPQAVAFTRLNEGFYELPLDSAALAPGTYHWMARAASGSTAVSLPEDAFVLVAPVTAAP